MSQNLLAVPWKGASSFQKVKDGEHLQQLVRKKPKSTQLKELRGWASTGTGTDHKRCF